MKKYTLEQLKTEKIAIHTPTQEIYDALIKEFEEKEIYLPHTDVFANDYQENTNIFIGKEIELDAAHTKYCESNKYIIITPDQIDWGEDKQDMIYPVICGSELNKTPLVFAKAQKDWNAFEAFLKEVEAYGRGLTSSQLKTFMANVRKDMGEVKK